MNMRVLCAVIRAYLDSFGGYGASISYSEAISNDNSQSVTYSNDFSFAAGFNFELNALIFSIGPVIKVGVSVGGGFSKFSSVERDQSVSRTRGFTLSDPDEYDAFDVQVLNSARCICNMHDMKYSNVPGTSGSSLRLFPVQHHWRTQQVCSILRVYSLHLNLQARVQVYC